MKQTIALLFSILIVSACGKGPDNSSNTGSIELVGFQRVDQTVTAYVTLADRNGTTDANLSFQWYANNSALVGETNSTIELVSDWLNMPMHVVVSYTDDDGFTETMKSESFDVLEAFLVLTMIADNEQSWRHAQTLDNSTSWSNPTDIVVSDPENEYTYGIDIASDGNGHLVAVAYSEESETYNDGPVIFSYSHDNGETWSDSARIATGGSDYYARVAYDGNGTWVAVWRSGEDYDNNEDDGDIVFSTSTDLGMTWSSPKVVGNLGADDSANDSMPALSVQGDNWVIAWRSSNDLSGTIGNDTDVLYTSTANGGQSWTDVAALNSDAATDSSNDLDYFVEVSIASNGFGVASWAGKFNESDLDIYIALTNDFGRTWSNERMLNDYGNDDHDIKPPTYNDQPYDSDYPESVYVDETGTAIVTWRGRYADEFGDDVEPLYSVSTDSGVTWSETRSLKADFRSDEENDLQIDIIANPNGGWIGRWSNSDVQIVTSDDLLAWSNPVPNGLVSGDSAAWIFH